MGSSFFDGSHHRVQGFTFHPTMCVCVEEGGCVPTHTDIRLHLVHTQLFLTRIFSFWTSNNAGIFILLVYSTLVRDKKKRKNMQRFGSMQSAKMKSSKRNCVFIFFQDGNRRMLNVDIKCFYFPFNIIINPLTKM